MSGGNSYLDPDHLLDLVRKEFLHLIAAVPAYIFASIIYKGRIDHTFGESYQTIGDKLGRQPESRSRIRSATTASHCFVAERSGPRRAAPSGNGSTNSPARVGPLLV